MTEHRRSPRLSALLVLFGLFTHGFAAVTPEQVDQAIKKGQAFLYSRQNKEGNWEQVQKPQVTGKDQQTSLTERQWGGLTAISTYALLASGESPKEPKLKPAIDFLKHANIQSTYGLGISAQVWTLLPQTPDTRAVITRTARMLDLGLIKKGESTGFYGYWTGLAKGSQAATWSDNEVGFVPQPRWWYDLSNSQYGVLGMWALDEAGAEVPATYWKTVDAAWKKAQKEDGGWSYRSDQEEKASMTAAGIATLFITQDYTLPDRWGNCKGGTPNANIEKGLAWMDQHVEQVLSEGNPYTMYGIERIGVASGRKYFGTVDWYEKGADVFVHRQGQDGSWGGSIPDTCFALVFLTRSSAPVMMNKLQYDLPKQPKLIEAWNERPRDAANLAHWAGRQLETFLNWQTVNLKVPPDEWHDAPILYIAGSQNIEFSQEHADKLRTFVEQGGMILANADCAQQPFNESMKRLARKLFPKYEARPLPANHVIFTRQQFPADKWRVRAPTLSVSNGVRELMVMVPDADPSRAWQTKADRTRQELFELGADLFLYAADRQNLQKKGQTYLVKSDPAIQPTRKVQLARLMAGDNPDPEPGGWRRMAAVLHNRDKIDLQVTNVTPGTGDLIGLKLAHLTGTTAFMFKDNARLEIKTFVDQGGTLIVDAAGGSPEFATAAEHELAAIFGPAAAKQLEQPLPPDSSLYKQPAVSIKTLGYRAYARQAALRNTKTPQIRGITVGKRIAVFYSREDLSAGLVGEPVDGIYGYDPQTATELMRAMILSGSK